jgi:hypothetical protein
VFKGGIQMQRWFFGPPYSPMNHHHFRPPFDPQQSPPSFMQSFLNQLKTKDGHIDFGKVASTAGQINKIIGQINPIVKQMKSFVKK